MASTIDTYTAPIFGRTDLRGYGFLSFDFTRYLEIRNNAAQQKKNQFGQVTKAGLYINSTYHDLQGSNNGSPVCDPRNQAWSWTVDGDDNAMAILAVPRRYGSGANTGENGFQSFWKDIMIEYMDGLEESENLTYDYYLCFENGSPSITIPNTLQTGNFVYYVLGNYLRRRIAPQTHEIYQYVPFNMSTLSTNTPDSQVSAVCPYSYAGANNKLEKILLSMDYLVANAMYVRNGNVYNAPYYTDETKDTLQTAVETALQSEDAEILKTVSAFPIVTNTYKIGAFIATGMPVFTIDHFDQLINYFAKRPFEPENNIDPPPSDWSTDWDIYIKGAQRPDIFITMKSNKVDEWLANLNENTSGVSKADIKVEYRYQKHTAEGSSWMSPVEYSKDYELVDWTRDIYNNVKDTSYNENITLNYPLILSEFMINEFDDGMIDSLFPYYAEMQFRLSYGKYHSAWCEYGIGVIGSPTVPDFSKMENWGEQIDEWSDSSTVTLHYDEYPPDYNPYPDPPVPPLPPPSPTDPSPNINGTGLLTTTYKITEDNARALGRFFWGKELFQKIKALNLSPLENVVSLTYMPINLDGTTSVIVVGNVDTNINGDKISGTTPIYTLGSVKLLGRYKSFLDYAPYTTANIFLPFVGFKPIDPQVFTGKTLSVKYSYDLIAGVCNAMLFADGIYIESHQGNCGIDIPLVASNRAEMMLGIVTSLVGTAVSPINTAGNIATDMLSMGTDILNAASSFHTSRQGGYSPTCAWTETRECFIVLETPNTWMGTTYAHDYGRPCLTTYSISQLSGFTVCDQTVDLSGISGATDEEKNMIKSILTNGFYA